jgi:hypothetical protein
MHSPSILFLALVALAAARPLPLNINLGAYSPALVVGDGAIEIEGEGAGGAPQLINSLQGGGIGGGQVAGAQPAAGQRAQVAGPGILSEPVSFYPFSPSVIYACLTSSSTLHYVPRMSIIS